MRQGFVNEIKFLVGNEDDFGHMENVPCFRPFSDNTVSFLQDLSGRLMEDRAARSHSDIAAFAFWCRKSSVLSMKERYADLKDRKGRGLSFHVAPSNIPVLFAFSFAASMLAGNGNIVRVSSRIFPQTEIICRHVSDLFGGAYRELGRANFIVSYPHSDAVTDYLSKACDSRIIWGGNHSIAGIRKSGLKPSAIELPFYDRFSFAVIGVKEYLRFENKEALAEKFYNDTYFSDQNACSSPRLVCWHGGGGTEEDTAEARGMFWKKLKEVADKKYPYQPIRGVDKISAAGMYAVAHGDGKMLYGDMSLVTVLVEELHGDLKNYCCPGGYFYEYIINDLNEVRPVCTADCQTLAYFGLERDEILKVTNSCSGVDRVVPIGSTMDFGLVWDGFDFITSLSRLVG